MYLIIENEKPVGFSNERQTDADVKVKDNELFLEGYTVVSGVAIYNPKHQLAFDVRLQRDSLLSKSDWTQTQDAPVDTQAWQEYRQALRDVTNQEGFPTTVVWPEEPKV